MSKAVDAILCAIFDLKMMESIFETDGVKEDKLYSDRTGGNASPYYS